MKIIYKSVKGQIDRLAHYRLCESYRHVDGVRQKVILHLGALDELPSIEQKQAFVHRINELVRQYQTAAFTLFEPSDDIVEQVAQKCLREIVQKQRIDFKTSPHQDLQVINLDSLQHEEVKEIGAEWLCMQAIEQLNIKPFLEQAGWATPDIQLALTHIASRAIYPASELKTSKWIRDNSAICELYSK